VNECVSVIQETTIRSFQFFASGVTVPPWDVFSLKRSNELATFLSCPSNAGNNMVLPQDILEKIIHLTDIETKVMLYESKMLKSITYNASVTEKWELEVFKYYYGQHKTKLKTSLDLLQYHVWDDGTPIKKFKEASPKNETNWPFHS
jgi:hypothetical protein